MGIQKLLCQRQISKLEENIKELETRIYLKDEGMEYALGTSQANYLDPRITVAWYTFYLFCQSKYLQLLVRNSTKVEISGARETKFLWRKFGRQIRGKSTSGQIRQPHSLGFKTQLVYSKMTANSCTYM